MTRHVGELLHVDLFLGLEHFEKVVLRRTHLGLRANAFSTVITAVVSSSNLAFRSLLFSRKRVHKKHGAKHQSSLTSAFFLEKPRFVSHLARFYLATGAAAAALETAALPLLARRAFLRCARFSPSAMARRVTNGMRT